MDSKIKIGISTCLLGKNVRYDGGHKLDRFLTQTLGQYVIYVPVCPEVECGMDTPREALRLVGAPETPRLVTIRGRRDYTDQMTQWANQKLLELETEHLCGFIFKSDSPSSGMERVKVYSDDGMPRKVGVGIFARLFMNRFPQIPVEEEGRLHDPKLRENFIEQIFTLQRWRHLRESGCTMKALIQFHTRHKLLILSHSPNHYQIMGKLTAAGASSPFDELVDQYESLLAQALKLKTTPRKNTNVLQHIMGYFKSNLTPDEKQELLDIIDEYYRENIPLIVPVTLLNHYARKYRQSYLLEQYYLNPHPCALQLRNHV